ncbi:hypothetical protein [Arthrobacter sp. AZCC_0090]|uniref:hypothetical protein n=1 Tax=Arthrobacter sp. AZCC_0090 TaxID=2735881 RepID=UPI00184B94C5|nr:hypothetical protein [Arthrobacter sp. AZCC_0090]MBB6406380.1 hypothetical protein [Arthrobacter sp. AZCC_0090]
MNLLPRSTRPSPRCCSKGAELVLQRHGRSREISEGLDFVMRHDADLLKRLEDA